MQSRRCTLNDGCEIEDDTVLPTDTVVPSFTVFGGPCGTRCKLASLRCHVFRCVAELTLHRSHEERASRVFRRGNEANLYIYLRIDAIEKVVSLHIRKLCFHLRCVSMRVWCLFFFLQSIIQNRPRTASKLPANMVSFGRRLRIASSA